MFGLIAQGALPDGAHADSVARLVAEGFVVLDGLRGNRPVALDPGEVAHRKMRRMLEENAARIAKMSELPAVAGQLGEEFRRSQWRAGEGSEYVDDVAAVNARLDDIVAGAEWEILAAQPAGPRTVLQLNRSVERDTAALGRGVAKRTLYLDTVRSAKSTAEYARTMTGLGAEFRTLASPFERCIVVDRRTAIVSNHLVEGAPEHSAWIISDRAFVAYVVAEYEEKWRRADRWAGELRGRGEDPVDTVSGASEGIRTTRRQREIMRDMVEGIPQQATARRLGVSKRTVAGDIDDLKGRFGAGSLMQLAIRWSQSPDRLVDDTGSAVDCPTGPKVGEGEAVA
ncbi:helix-turn-helix transcriptional regulator [Streptomyces griseorubiginosus]|uniref:helix-turn-helix transcriptional regulator n=1 Tax=Streptomyces griseorubiginosus TaxID=67304 RepID=UPI00340BCE8B